MTTTKAIDGNEEIAKDLAPIREQVSKATDAANALVVAKTEDLQTATELLGKIKKVGKMITLKKESITKPLNEALRNARAFFSPVESQYNEAERIVKNKMVDFQIAETAKAAKKTAVIEKKVEAGKMSFDTAAEKIEAVTPKATVASQESVAQFRKVKEVVLEDESLLPREYLVPDLVKIRKVVLAGVTIPGVKVVEKQVVAGLTR